MKPVVSCAATGVLPSDWMKRPRGLDGRITREDRADDLDELHHGGGVEEVEPENLGGPLRRGGQLGERARRGVRRQEGMRRADRSRRANVSFLITGFSVMASITRSTPPRGPRPGGSPQSPAGGVTLAGSEPALVNQRIQAPRSLEPPLQERLVRLHDRGRYPAWATTWAIPLPMSPHPTTPTFEIVIPPPSGTDPTGAHPVAGERRGGRPAPGPPRCPPSDPWCIPLLSIVWRRVRCSAVSSVLPCSIARSRAKRSSARSCATSRTFVSTFARSAGSCSRRVARSSSAIRMSASLRIASRANSPRSASSLPTCSGVRPRSFRWCSMIVISGRSAGSPIMRPGRPMGPAPPRPRQLLGSSAPRLPSRSASWSTSRPASSADPGLCALELLGQLGPDAAEAADHRSTNRPASSKEADLAGAPAMAGPTTAVGREYGQQRNAIGCMTVSYMR